MLSDICHEPLWPINQRSVMHMQKPTGIYEMPIQEKYMLSLKEAGAYFNISIKKMRRMAELNEGGFAF